MNKKLEAFYRGRSVLVTGYNGFKGTWICKVLEYLGADVSGYSAEPPTVPSLFEECTWPEHFRFYRGDIRDLERMLQVFQEIQPEIVIHMAAQPLVRESYAQPVATFDINVMGTVHLMECVRQTESVRSVINVTTDKVYRNEDLGRLFRETDELGGNDPYAASKACSELVTQSYRRSFLDEQGVAVSTVRAGNVIGGGDFAADRIVPDCFRAAESGKPIIMRNPDAVRPFEHVLEPLAAYLAIAAEQTENAALAGSYNVGPDESGCFSVIELVKEFSRNWKKITDKELPWEVHSDGGPRESKLLMLDCSLLKEVFGLEPEWPIQKAVEKTVEWYAAYAEGNGAEACMLRQIEEYYGK